MGLLQPIYDPFAFLDEDTGDSRVHDSCGDLVFELGLGSFGRADCRLKVFLERIFLYSPHELAYAPGGFPQGFGKGHLVIHGQHIEIQGDLVGELPKFLVVSDDVNWRV
jgi:hypothetical protein